MTIPPGTDTLVNLQGIQTLINKTLTLPTIASLKDGSGNTVSVPVSTDTLVNLQGAQTLANKTLTLPTIASLKDGSGNTVSVPVGTDTLVNLQGAQTLTNKTLTTPIINGVTISGTPSTGQVLQATSGSAASWASIVVPYTATVSTTDATPTLITTITGADNTSYLGNITILGNRTSGGTECYGEVLRFMYKRSNGAGTIAQIGLDNTVVFNSLSSLWSASSSADTTNGKYFNKSNRWFWKINLMEGLGTGHFIINTKVK